MKRILSLLMVFVMTAALLSGCGKQEEPTAPSQDTTAVPTTVEESEEEGPDDVPIQLEPAGNVVSAYTFDEVDHASKPDAETKTVRLHYRRNDDNANDRSCYAAWNVWAWDMTNSGNGAAYPFTGYDDFGVYADLDIDTISGGLGLEKMGFIVRTDDWAKDPDGDRFIDIKPMTPDGIQNVYVRTTESTVFETQENACKSIISYAMLQDSKTVSVYFKPLSNDFASYKPRFGLTVNGKEYTDFTMAEYDNSLKRANLLLQDDIDLSDVVTVSYRFDPSWINRVELMMTNYFDTDEFNERYAYSGEDLGVTFDNEEAPKATTFKVWAPTSTKMVLNLYKTGDYMTEKEPYAVYEMERGEKGVYSVTLPEDLDGVYYTYTVTNSKGTNEVADPYAKSAGVNGRRGMAVNFTKLNRLIKGWDEDKRPFEGNNVDAVIYEAHVRDMTVSETSGIPEEVRGTFTGLSMSGTYTEDGITVSTGLEHLRELGITHLQLQPFYDYSSVDETRVSGAVTDDNYNWGYDPLNYNVPEGSYSTDPQDGYMRIKELKKLVLALHEAGISLNMDVVYNHTSSSENSNFNLLVPYYYYRTKANGSFYNGSGCGNEVASERYMVNKFIRESCRFWIGEYHLSGFRFDLMGLLDNQTMIDVYNDCKQLDPHIMVYGEPWTGGTSKLKDGTIATNLKSQKTVQTSLAQDYFCGNGVLVGAFNDVIRNAIRGGNTPGKGFVQGSSADASMVAMCVEGRFSQDTVKAHEINPNQVLNYVSCHDNYTLYDQLAQTMNEERLPIAYTQADSIIFLSQGVPFIQEGEEFMRSKFNEKTGKYEGNSYNVGDSVNLMDYSLKIKNAKIYEKTAEMIRLRREHPEFRLSDRSEFLLNMHILPSDKGTILYSIGDLLVVHSLNGSKIELDGNWKVIYSNVRTSYDAVSGTFSAGTNESAVLQKVQ